MRTAAAALLATLLAAAVPAAAQPADPIGDILARHTDEDSAESGRVQPKLDAEPDVPDTPTGPAPHLAAPVNVEETGKTPDRPPTTRDLAYESRIRASFANAQGFQGPLDGGWTLAAAGGGDLYAFELADKGRGVVEGAWRDLHRTGAPAASGFIDRIERVGEEMTLTFDDGVTARLVEGPAGWAGQLLAHGQSRPVSLRRSP
jgi:hypothetical protein